MFWSVHLDPENNNNSPQNPYPFWDYKPIEKLFSWPIWGHLYESIPSPFLHNHFFVASPLSPCMEKGFTRYGTASSFSGMYAVHCKPRLGV